MKNMIIAHNGSVQNIPGIPDDVKAIYKTVWEISQKKVLDLAADRGAFICQSQSLNVHLQSPTLGQLTSMHFYGWKKGLKTGMYYLRTRPAAQAIQFTVDQSLINDAKKAQAAGNRGIENPAPAPVASTPKLPNGTAPAIPVRQEDPVTSPMTSSTSSIATTSSDSVDELGVSTTTAATKGAAGQDPEFAAALQRQRDREAEEAKLMCSLENKEACVMCSG